jgi:hypothetical protein
MMRLGAEIFGSNEDLAYLPREGDKPREGGDPCDSDDDDTGESGEGDGNDSDDSDDADGEGKGGGDDEDSDDDSEGKGSGDDDSDEEDDEDEDGDTDGDDGDDDSDEDGDDSDSEGDDPKGKTDDSDSDEQTDDVDPNSNKDAGGHDDQGEFAEAMIDGLKAPETAGLKDNNSALEDATNNCRADDDCESGERVWRPYDASLDTVAKPKGNREQSERMRKAAAVICAAFRTQFRRRFLQAKNPRIRHGVRRGRDLSEERLVESYVEILSGVRPSRPDYKIEAEEDVSIAIGVVVDQSGSMHGREQHAAAVSMIAIAEAFDSLNAPVMCCGPRNGGRGTRGGRDTFSEDYYAEDNAGGSCERPDGNYHRHSGVRIDLFKDWNESFKQCKDRFSAVQATGSTPLSDGVQFALQELSTRPERHRVIIVLTDGSPDQPAVVRRQIRLAKEAGIIIVGIGISGAEYYLPQLFPEHHIVVHDLTMLPKRMMEVIGAIIFPKTAKKANLDGKIGNARQRRRA